MRNKLEFYVDVKPITEEPNARKKLIEWLLEHPIWRDSDGDQHFDEWVDIDFLPFVNPKTGEVDTDENKNTVMAIRIEAGEQCTHDRRFDYWSPSLEEALLELAQRVQFFYDDSGVERTDIPQPCILECHEFSRNYCTKCGFVRNWWKHWGRCIP